MAESSNSMQESRTSSKVEKSTEYQEEIENSSEMKKIFFPSIAGSGSHVALAYEMLDRKRKSEDLSSIVDSPNLSHQFSTLPITCDKARISRFSFSEDQSIDPLQDEEIYRIPIFHKDHDLRVGVFGALLASFKSSLNRVSQIYSHYLRRMDIQAQEECHHPLKSQLKDSENLQEMKFPKRRSKVKSLSESFIHLSENRIRFSNLSNSSDGSNPFSKFSLNEEIYCRPTMQRLNLRIPRKLLYIFLILLTCILVLTLLFVI